MFVDRQGRTLNYLRLAVTDKCNLRCRYCMPEEGMTFLKDERLLSDEELMRLCRLMSANGITKIRITGGEPFVRPGLPTIFRAIAPLFKSINVTTNATLLDRVLDKIQIPNIGSLNISLDSLNPLTFLAITKRDQFEKVWANVMRAYDLGWRIKINNVVMRGVNDHEIPDFLELARTMKVDVRFIEAMPFNGYDQNDGLMMGHDEILKVIESHYSHVKRNRVLPVRSASIRYDVTGFEGSVGIIPAYTRTLCGFCNRIRITADGILMNCLYSQTGLDLKPLLRNGSSDALIVEAMQSHLWEKPVDGFEAERQRAQDSDFQSMTRIGG